VKEKLKVGYPKLGNYYVPIYNLLNNLVDKEYVDIIVPDKMTDKILKKGAVNSPDFICTPFKYNMGNFIDALEKGANVLIQAGGGCRYGYYSELQEKILRDLGYDFIFINLMGENGLNILDVYKKIKILNSKLSFKEFCYHFFIGFKLINFLDVLETYMRENYTLQINPKDFDNIHKSMLKEMENINSIKKLNQLESKYKKLVYDVNLRKYLNSDIKIGIVGELFTSMEPYASFYLEKELNKYNCSVKRYTTATYLLFEKGFCKRKILKRSGKYLNHLIGADGAESISRTLELIENGYDGIIHIKPFGCMPEINAMPILQKIAQDKLVPIMYLTFDEQTTATGMNTRIEAFYDMIKMQKEEKLKENKRGEIIAK
jgi:predicted nucleotide-binding protein (sugar kinase/HSP70/actin superfamily)